MDFPIEEFVNRISYIMKIDDRLSNTFYLLNVISILLIVCMHSVVPAKEVSSQIVVNFVFKGITRIAVPIFFLVSSCLFFRDYKDSLYWQKIQKKVPLTYDSLLCNNPYLFHFLLLYTTDTGDKGFL